MWRGHEVVREPVLVCTREVASGERRVGVQANEQSGTPSPNPRVTRCTRLPVTRTPRTMHRCPSQIAMPELQAHPLQPSDSMSTVASLADVPPRGTSARDSSAAPSTAAGGSGRCSTLSGGSAASARAAARCQGRVNTEAVMQVGRWRGRGPDHTALPSHLSALASCCKLDVTALLVPADRALPSAPDPSTHTPSCCKPTSAAAPAAVTACAARPRSRLVACWAAAALASCTRACGTARPLP